MVVVCISDTCSQVEIMLEITACESGCEVTLWKCEELCVKYPCELMHEDSFVWHNKINICMTTVGV